MDWLKTLIWWALTGTSNLEVKHQADSVVFFAGIFLTLKN